MTRSSRLSFSLATGLLVVLAAVAPRPAAADPWQPLAIGSRWEYRGVGGSHQVEHITGTFMLRGRTVAMKSYDEGVDAGLENYWLLGADGTVFLCGFNNPGAALALAYEPPIAYLPGPPALGVSRTTNVTAYDLSNGSVYMTFSIGFSVLEEVDLSLPAGLFHALGTGQVPVAPGAIRSGGRAFSLDGRLLAGAAPASTTAVTAATDWYADGIGLVQYQSGDLYQMVSIGLPTALAQSSWSAIKRLYR